ncbi:hypothetical protein COP2_042950 [Malus domestica]
MGFHSQKAHFCDSKEQQEAVSVCPSVSCGLFFKHERPVLPKPYVELFVVAGEEYLEESREVCGVGEFGYDGGLWLSEIVVSFVEAAIGYNNREIGWR